MSLSSVQAKAAMPIRASAAQVFDAFVEPAHLTCFWLAGSSAPLGVGRAVQWEFLVPGAQESVTATSLDRPSHLAFDWSDGVHVDIRIEEQRPGIVVVAVVASGFKDAGSAIDATEGFSLVLCELKNWLESGRTANLVRDKAAMIAGTI